MYFPGMLCYMVVACYFLSTKPCYMLISKDPLLYNYCYWVAIGDQRPVGTLHNFKDFSIPD